MCGSTTSKYNCWAEIQSGRSRIVKGKKLKIKIEHVQPKILTYLQIL